MSIASAIGVFGGFYYVLGCEYVTKFSEGDTLKTFDYVVANPPFSDKSWNNGLDPILFASVKLNMSDAIDMQFKLFGTFPVTQAQRERYKCGELWLQWFKDYPNIFHESDQKVAENDGHRGVGFYESLAAILIYNLTGYVSLVDYYQYRPHARKNEIFRQLVGDELADSAYQTKTYCPDLLVYKPDLSNWYFVEVKGPTDRLRPNQVELFAHLQSITHKSVYILQFTLLPE